MQTQRYVTRGCVSLAVMVLLLFAVGGCGPASSPGASLGTPTPAEPARPTPTTQATIAPTSTSTLPAPTLTTAAATATPLAPTATTAATATKVAPTATKPPTTQVPATAKTFKSTKHHYVISYPANWTINVQTPSGAGTDAENVNLRSASASLPAVQIYALKGAPPILGFENCNKNLVFRGVPACSMSLPKGQMPATQLLIFQKDASHYHVAAEYEVQEQLGVFDEIVRSFQFVP